MTFMKIIHQLKPKRSPIFLALIALVLIYTTPLMFVMAEHSFQSWVGIAETLMKGETLDLGDKMRGRDILFLNTGFLMITLAVACVFAAMVFLVLRKYGIAPKFLLAAPFCCWFGYRLMGQSDFFSAILGNAEVMTLSVTTPYLLIAVTLFLYAKKYSNIDRVNETA